MLNHRGVNYYKTDIEAEQIRQEFIDAYPQARLVPYLIGYAVQYRPSGAYYPEILDECSLTFGNFYWR